jgi:hypothetical protein
MALSAGLEERGEVVALLDGDLQDPPEPCRRCSSPLARRLRRRLRRAAEPAQEGLPLRARTRSSTGCC